MQMKRSSKLLLAEPTPQLYTCNDEEVMEIIFLQPYEMLNMVKRKRINFSGFDAETDILAEKVQNCVSEVDSATLAQNLTTPYLFVTLKRYVDDR